jgi:hypothetical protein
MKRKPGLDPLCEIVLRLPGRHHSSPRPTPPHVRIRNLSNLDPTTGLSGGRTRLLQRNVDGVGN